MKILHLIIPFIIFAVFSSCNNISNKDTLIAKSYNEKFYAKEPADSYNYKLIKYDFYSGKDGQLFERKLVSAKETNCDCLFKVYYDSLFKIYQEDTIIEKPLKTVVDISSFIWIDSSDFSKDLNKVYYFYGNSDGGNRVIVSKADPGSFRRLCEYQWGIDKNYVYYKDFTVEGLNLKQLQILYPVNPSDHFIQYIKDDKNIFYENKIVSGADVKTFKVVNGKEWEAEDKSHKYKCGKKVE